MNHRLRSGRPTKNHFRFLADLIKTTLFAIIPQISIVKHNHTTVKLEKVSMFKITSDYFQFELNFAISSGE